MHRSGRLASSVFALVLLVPGAVLDSTEAQGISAGDRDTPDGALLHAVCDGLEVKP
jgi:hypothetical protein